MGRTRSSRGEGDQFLVLPKQMVRLTKRWWIARLGGGLALCCHPESDSFRAWKSVESQIQEPDADLCSLSIP